MGILVGVVAVLLTVVVMQNREPQAFAAAPAAPQSVDNTGQGLLMGSGSATANQNDVLWIVYKHAAKLKPGASEKDVTAKDERVTLCCYQVQNGARSIKLAAVRDISFDLDVVEYMNDKPHVKDIIEELKKSQPKEK
jgi:hypothetical protein